MANSTPAMPDGTVNSVDNPAAAGSMVTLFMTGAGLMDPAIADGVVGPSDPPHPTPTQPVYAAINGTLANVVSVFQAPGKIAGIVQVKIQIPAEVPVGDALVKIAVGGNGDPASFPSQPKTTVAVR